MKTTNLVAQVVLNFEPVFQDGELTTQVLNGFVNQRTISYDETTGQILASADGGSVGVSTADELPQLLQDNFKTQFDATQEIADLKNQLEAMASEIARLEAVNKKLYDSLVEDMEAAGL